MTVRNIFSRVEKLEARRRRPDDLLLIWRLPGAPVSEAVADARFASGDRVICAEWFGDSSAPAPRWFGKRSRQNWRAPSTTILFNLSIGWLKQGLCANLGLRPSLLSPSTAWWT